MKCANCFRMVPEERLNIGMTTCMTCAQSVKRYRGDMNYAHKTAPTIMIMSEETFSDYRRYVPYSRYSGRGSGVHAMSRPTAKLG